MAKQTIYKITAGGENHLIASSAYGTCTTAAATAEKDVTLTDSTTFSLVTGITVHVKFTKTNTVANPKLDVASSGAKAIMRYGTTTAGTAVTTSWPAGAIVSFTYDGTNWLMNDYQENTDTHWTTHLYAGTGSAANATATNGNVKLSVADNTSVRSSITIQGSGAATVTSDANGVITVNSTNTTYTAANAAPANVAASSVTGTSTNYARQDHTHGIALATGDSNGQVKIAGTNVSVKGLGTAAYTASTDYAPSVEGFEYIRGTWTAASGTWTGVTTDTALVSGKKIILYMPFAGSGNATLNLTLAGGGTTGAKNVYYESTSRFTTHKGAYSQLPLIYLENHSINGTNYTGWWYLANRDTNSYDRLQHANNIKASAAVAAAWHVVVGTSAGYHDATAGSTFDINYPILTNGAAWTANTNYTNAYHAIPTINLATTKSGWTGTAGAQAYLVATLSGNTATIDSAVFTTTVPTSADNKVYFPLGVMTSTTAVYFAPTNDMYAYIDGSFNKVSPKDIKSITRSSLTFTATRIDGKTFTFNQKDDTGNATIAWGAF